MNTDVLKNEETVALRLRELYRRYGYSCFKMSKFEEYDLYSQNKDFLVSDNVITFTDMNGKLMALKPDVTLSIVKNFKNGSIGVQRVYYNENVYRVSEKTHNYKEIMQIGLECLGDIDRYNLFEVLGLAAKSLMAISDNYVLSISHLGILTNALKTLGDSSLENELTKCVGEKNAHGIRELCEAHNVSSSLADLLIYLTSSYGEISQIENGLKKYTDDSEILECARELEAAAFQIRKIFGAHVNIDLSLVNDINYYNGIVFQGFIQGIPSCVLSGGQYDKLVLKMGKKAKAVGFAVYLDLLERMQETAPYTADVLLIYKASDDMAQVQKRVEELTSSGKTVSAQTEIPENLNYRETEMFGGR